jgi:hypothetical protein
MDRPHLAVNGDDNYQTKLKVLVALSPCCTVSRIWLVSSSSARGKAWLRHQQCISLYGVVLTFGFTSDIVVCVELTARDHGSLCGKKVSWEQTNIASCSEKAKWMLKPFRNFKRFMMTAQPPRKRPRLNEPRAPRKPKPVAVGSAEDIIAQIDAVDILGAETVASLRAANLHTQRKFESMQEVELDIVGLSSHGEGLGVTEARDWLVVVPFCLPGERVRAKIYRNTVLHSYADLLEVLSTGISKRNDALIGCKYFGKCSGCQLQMLSYEDQLAHKQTIVKKAFNHLSGNATACIRLVCSTNLQALPLSNLSTSYQPFLRLFSTPIAPS